MALKAIISPLAIEDLKQIAEFVSADDSRSALKLGEELIQRAESLESFPQRGRIVPEFREPDLRESIHNPYRIVYRIQEQPPCIEIVRFWHASRGTPEVE